MLAVFLYAIKEIRKTQIRQPSSESEASKSGFEAEARCREEGAKEGF